MNTPNTSQPAITRQPHWLRLLSGSILLGLPLMALPSMAQQAPGIPSPGVAQPAQGVLNPNPSIFNEFPYNRVPRQQLLRIGPSPAQQPAPGAVPGSTQGVEPISPRPGIFNEPPYNTLPTLPTAAPSQPPLPEQQQAPSGQITPVGGRVSVRMRNATNTNVMYQVIGHTGERMLTGRSEVNLENLPLGVTLTFVRPDGGLIQVQPEVTSPGVLELSLNEATDLGADRGTLRIGETGQFFIN